MHSQQLAAVASWAAFNSNFLIQQLTAMTAESCNEFWSQSKCRQTRWMIALKMFESDLQNQESNHDPWPAIEIVIQEIFLSEILTRVWSALMVSNDVHYHSDELTGIAHSIHVGHLEAKNRAMRLLLADESADPEVFDRLNTIRRKAERWTDLLLGQLENVEAAQRFAFQINRVKDFHTEKQERNADEKQTYQTLYSTSLNEDLRKNSSQYSANPEINRKIAGGVLSCFPNSRFDSVGLPKSAQLIWLERSTNETELLVNSLENLDRQPINEGLGTIHRSSNN